MTNNQLTDERLVKILSETQATIMEHNSRCVRGSLEVDARLFESMIMELQERRKAAMDCEPVAGEARFKEERPCWTPCTAEHVSMVLANPEDWPNYEVRYLYAAPQPAPVVPDERAAFNAWNNDENLPIAGVGAKNAAWLAWQARAELAGNSPVIPDGYVIVPMRLTDENGAKGALAGEFSETRFVNCPECFLSHDFGDDECETCDGSGRIEIKVPVSWTAIKEIWAKGVEHFAAAPPAPKQENI
ncbi:TPA: hypothetical protein ACHOZL_003055 [Raoultella ornithinolytica]